MLGQYAEATREGKLSDILVGYLDPADEVPRPPQVVAGAPPKTGDKTEEKGGRQGARPRRGETALRRAEARPS